MLVTDFDATLTHLAVDWAGLRARLRVRTMAELWRRPDVRAFDIVAAAERDGARAGQDNAAALRFVRGFTRFAVLTDNSKTAVDVFLERHPDLRKRCAAVVGRETLGAPKRERAAFGRGMRICIDALGDPRVPTVTFLGDAAYELALAAELGLAVIDVASLPVVPAAAPGPEGKAEQPEGKHHQRHPPEHVQRDTGAE